MIFFSLMPLLLLEKHIYQTYIIFYIQLMLLIEIFLVTIVHFIIKKLE